MWLGRFHSCPSPHLAGLQNQADQGHPQGHCHRHHTSSVLRSSAKPSPLPRKPFPPRLFLASPPARPKHRLLQEAHCPHNNPESRLSDDKDLPVGHSSVLKMLRFRLLRGNGVYSTACGSFRPGAVGDNSDHRGGCRRLGRAGRIAFQGQAPPFHCANLAFRKTSSAIHD